MIINVKERAAERRYLASVARGRGGGGSLALGCVLSPGPPFSGAPGVVRRAARADTGGAARVERTVAEEVSAAHPLVRLGRWWAALVEREVGVRRRVGLDSVRVGGQVGVRGDVGVDRRQAPRVGGVRVAEARVAGHLVVAVDHTCLLRVAVDGQVGLDSVRVDDVRVGGQVGVVLDVGVRVERRVTGICAENCVTVVVSLLSVDVGVVLGGRIIDRIVVGVDDHGVVRGVDGRIVDGGRRTARKDCEQQHVSHHGLLTGLTGGQNFYLHFYL